MAVETAQLRTQRPQTQGVRPSVAQQGQYGRHWMNAYRRVEERLSEFRRDHPLWTIQTKLLVLNQEHAVFEAHILDEAGRVLSSGHKRVLSDRENYVELAETGAVGRALHFLGYKTTDDEEDEV